MTKVLATYDPTSYAQAKVKTLWEQAMSSKYEYFLRNKTWSFVPLPLGKNLVGCKWVYKTKFTANRKIEKYRAILVTKGFNQLEGINYNETTAPIAKMNTIRTVLSIDASYKWELHQIYVKSYLLNGYLNEDIYMQHPPSFVFS